MYHLSAANLVKYSARKNVWMTLENKRAPTNDAQKRGNKHADKIAKQTSLREMRGSYLITDETTLHFSWDSITDTSNSTVFTEIKMAEKPLEDWYYYGSLCQISLYATLAEQTNSYITASFARAKYGFNEFQVDRTKEQEYVLKLGKAVMDVRPSVEVLAFYEEKAYNIATRLHDYKLVFDWATEYDAKWKHVEWKYLKQYLKYIG